MHVGFRLLVEDANKVRLSDDYFLDPRVAIGLGKPIGLGNPFPKGCSTVRV